MFSRIESIGLFELDSYMFEIDADVSGGLPNFDIVGLPNATVRVHIPDLTEEERERRMAKIKRSAEQLLREVLRNEDKKQEIENQ